ncbi:SH3 domain and tetratricopeptide repeat-containing protein 1 isoform 2-T2 [Menidia menidia]
MSRRSHRDSGCPRARRGTPGEGQQPRAAGGRPRLRSSSVRSFCRDATGLKTSLSACEENFPTVRPVLMEVVQGPDRLPAGEDLQEMLSGKLRLLQVDSAEVNNLFTELSTRLLSVNSEEKTIYVTFKTFEEIWKFTTYYMIGLLGHCLENVLLDQTVWLKFLEEDVAIEVSIEEETLNLFYKGILMQEGSLFASCSANQMFDSSTSGGDLYLEQGDIAQFEPPFLGSGWTVLCLDDGARGTSPKPALEPLIPFHQWFLKSCTESILIGDGKPTCDFPLRFARGVCVATEEYEAEGPDELSVAAGERIAAMGFLVPCFGWFMGRKEATGEVGLVKTSLVRPSAEMWESVDIILDGEEWMFSVQHEDKVMEETIDMLKKKSQIDVGHNYKLDMIGSQDSEKNPSSEVMSFESTHQTELKKNILRILTQDNHSSPDSVLTRNESSEGPQCPPSFTVHPVVEEKDNTENFIPLFSFLDGQDYRPDFGFLYGQSSEQLSSTIFSGHRDEDELIAFLSSAREAARKRRLLWTQTRLCFLLGRFCAGKSKFSQARVYFEESLCVPQEAFTDLQLLASIYSNLAAIYLLQKNRDSFFDVSDRLVALLFGIPDCLKSMEDVSVLKYILKKAVLSHNRGAEARACYLLARHHWTRDQGDLVAPYLERLLVLGDEVQRKWSIPSSYTYLCLGGLYSKLNLPHLSVCSARIASLQPSASLSHSLSSLLLVLDNVDKQDQSTNQDTSIPPVVAPYLQQALSFIEIQRGGGSALCSVLRHQLSLSLSQLYYKCNMVKHAIRQMDSLISSNPSPDQVLVSVSERNSALIWLAWLHMSNRQHCAALDILDTVLASIDEHRPPPQKGVVLNLRGVALRCMGDHLGAAESYQAAADLCQGWKDRPNCAVAKANLGLLCLKTGAKRLAQRHLIQAVKLFSEISEEGHEANFIPVLLELGQHYVKEQHLDYGKGCYEWALLLAIKAGRADWQISATRQLCHLYGHQSPDQAQSIIYLQHQAHLLGCTGDKIQEGDTLEAISQLCLSLGTQREKEAYGWLKAGRIHHLLGQTELVDIYVQAAQDVALSTGDTGFILKLLEAAGDIFFNSRQDQDKAITFYRDRALPIAVKTSSACTRLRLCNKLTEVMLGLKLYAEAVEFAHTAVEISISLGEQLNERVAYHRLASLYHHLEQYELAEHFYLKTLSRCPSPLEFDEETMYYVRVYQTLGDIIFCDLKDPFDAAGYYHLALAAAIDLGNKKSQLQLCTRLATIYHNFLQDRELSLFFYQKARGFAAELNVRRINISSDQRQRSMSQYNHSGE